MKSFLHACLFAAIAMIAACSLAPARIFQAEVPKPISKPVQQIESERRAADLIARKLESPAALKPVAVELSASLGAPEKPILADTPEQLAKGSELAVAELTASVVAMQRQIVALNKTLIKYQGKDIEGTGLSLLGPGTMAIAIGLVVLAIACPPALTLMMFAYRRLKAAAKIVVNQVEEAAQAPETRDAIAVVKQRVSKAMGEHSMNTKRLKATILDLKKA